MQCQAEPCYMSVLHSRWFSIHSSAWMLQQFPDGQRACMCSRGVHLHSGPLTVCCAAVQLATGWGVWKELGSRKSDYNLRFATGGAQALQAALGPAEACDFKCTFSAALGDDWTHYLRTCAAGALPKPHDFPHPSISEVFCPDTESIDFRVC